MTDLATNIENTLEKKLFDILDNKTEYILEENTGNGEHHNNPYTIKLKFPRSWINDTLIVIKHIENFKVNIPYLNGDRIPKDSDYIIINENKRYVLFFELKDTKADAVSVGKQLQSSRWWAEHLIFCSSYPFDINSYSDFFLKEGEWEMKYAELLFCRGRPSYARNTHPKRRAGDFEYVFKECKEFDITKII